MSKKKTGKNDKDNFASSGDEYIDFTPSAGFDIRKAAPSFSQLMNELQQPLIIHFPNISVEYEIGCTAKEIVDGYNQGLKASVSAKLSNSNTKKK